MTQQFKTLNELCGWIDQQCPADLRVAAPLGLGKPHRLLNALYDTARKNSKRSLHIMTALSLTPPSASSDLEKRFLQPFLDRHFATFEPLQYAIDQRRNQLPANIKIEEFYLQSGGLLNSAAAQQDYASLNYTHVARAVASKQPHVIVQLVAREPNGTRLSLSCNPDLTFDLLDRIQQQGQPRPLLIAEVHPDLPFMSGAAIAPDNFFDAIIDLPLPAPALFALPRQPVSLAEFAIGFYASTLVKDGGTLQIGIGALSDALTHALILRHTRNPDYKRILRALWPAVDASPLVQREGGLEPFQRGLYGASEMVMDGFMHLIRAGVIKRRVVDDLQAMQRIENNKATQEDESQLNAEGVHLHGGFFLGSKELYQWLRDLPVSSDSTRDFSTRA
jgi:acyl-CoA hydrolase